MTGERMRIGVIGAGAWGTALAANAARAGSSVMLWTRSEEHAQSIDVTRTNERYLPGVQLPDALRVTSDLSAACTGADIVLMCVPAQTLGALSRRCAVHIAQGTVLVSCAKGIDRASGRTMTEVMVGEGISNPVAVLSGPSFAMDVVRFKPTAVTVAARDAGFALDLARRLSNDTLRCYASDDVRGVEIGGALKNVLAIAVGIAHGAGLGSSAEAALVARGFAEMSRIATALGARAETMTGLSGLGDLVLTCSSEKSRNFAYGIAIGERRSLDGMKLAEGAHTASIAAYIVRRDGIDAPLTQSVAQVLDGQLSVSDAIATLLTRPIRTE